MKYFCSNEEREGLCYVEFCNVNNGELWEENSLFIEDELMGEETCREALKEINARVENNLRKKQVFKIFGV